MSYYYPLQSGQTHNGQMINTNQIMYSADKYNPGAHNNGGTGYGYINSNSGSSNNTNNTNSGLNNNSSSSGLNNNTINSNIPNNATNVNPANNPNVHVNMMNGMDHVNAQNIANFTPMGNPNSYNGVLPYIPPNSMMNQGVNQNQMQTQPLTTKQQFRQTPPMPSLSLPPSESSSVVSSLSSVPPKLRKRAFSKRSKTGCFTCRERRIKCDECKPICKNCSKSRRTCHFPDPENIKSKKAKEPKKPGKQKKHASKSSTATKPPSDLNAMLGLQQDPTSNYSHALDNDGHPDNKTSRVSQENPVSSYYMNPGSYNNSYIDQRLVLPPITHFPQSPTVSHIPSTNVMLMNNPLNVPSTSHYDNTNSSNSRIMYQQENPFSYPINSANTVTSVNTSNTTTASNSSSSNNSGNNNSNPSSHYSYRNEAYSYNVSQRVPHSRSPPYGSSTNARLDHTDLLYSQNYNMYAVNQPPPQQQPPQQQLQQPQQNQPYHQ